MTLEKVLLLILAAHFTSAFYPDEFTELSRLTNPYDPYPDESSISQRYDNDDFQTSETRHRDDYYSGDDYDSREEYDDDYRGHPYSDDENEALRSDDKSDAKLKREEYFESLSTKSRGAYRSGTPRPYKLKSVEDMVVQASDPGYAPVQRTRRARLSDNDLYYPRRQVKEDQPERSSSRPVPPTSVEVFERAYEGRSYPTSTEDFAGSERKYPESKSYARSFDSLTRRPMYKPVPPPPSSVETNYEGRSYPTSTEDFAGLERKYPESKSYARSFDSLTRRPMYKPVPSPPSSVETNYESRSYPTSTDGFGGSYRKIPESKSSSITKSFENSRPVIKPLPPPTNLDYKKPFTAGGERPISSSYLEEGSYSHGSRSKSYSPGSGSKSYSPGSRSKSYSSSKSYDDPKGGVEDNGAITKTYSSPKAIVDDFAPPVSSAYTNTQPRYPDPETYSPPVPVKKGRRKAQFAGLTKDGGSYAVPKPKDLAYRGKKGSFQKGRSVEDFPSSSTRRRPGLLTEENRHFLSATGYGKPMRQQFHEQGTTGPHSYKFGYNTGDKDNPMARYEERSPDGLVKGSYSYVDPLGKLKVVHYESHPETGFKTTL